MRLTIFQRLTIGYLAMILLVVGLGVHGTVQLNRISRLIHQAAHVDGERIRLAEDLSDRLTTLVALDKKFWISGDPDFEQLFLKRSQEFDAVRRQLEALGPSAEIDAVLAGLGRDSETYFRLFAQRTADPGGISEADYTQVRDAMAQNLSRALRGLALTADADRYEKIRQSAVVSAGVVRATLAFALAGVLMGLAAAFLTTRRIVRPIVVLQRKTGEIAEGHFERIGEMAAPPEIRGLADDFNAMCERLKELETLKEDFVRHVSHEMRTPLTAIREASGMLLDGTVDPASEGCRQLLSIVQTECERLIVSVNRILDLSRMEARMMDYRFEPTDLMELFEAVLRKLAPIARKKSIALTIDAREPVSAVRADREQLLQLLENLVGNALKFTEAGGAVSIRIQPVSSDNGRVQVSVTDTGCGIAPEHLELIFEKFRRIDMGKGTQRGTGLGLSIAKHIVSAHGGRIWVDSREGAGSTFHFTIPSSCSA